MRGGAGFGADAAAGEPGWVAGVLNVLSQLEGPVLLWIQETLRGPLDGLVSWYTRMGNAGLLWIALCLLLLCFPKTRRAGAVGALALVFSLVFTNLLLKHLVARTRPWVVFPELIPLVVERDPNSFPSGHTSAAFCCAMAWRHTLPERWMRVTALVLAVLMGLSRLYVGVHFPSDVLCGALVGGLCGELAWLAAKGWQEHRERVY